MAPVDGTDTGQAAVPASPVVRAEHVAEHVAAAIAADIAAVVKADQRYAPLIGALAARVLAAFGV